VSYQSLKLSFTCQIPKKKSTKKYQQENIKKGIPFYPPFLRSPRISVKCAVDDAPYEGNTFIYLLLLDTFLWHANYGLN
jgi:hypothetical protein